MKLVDVLPKLKAGESKIGVVGLGYVGLPLACLLAKRYKVVGFDINAQRVRELRDGHDRTREVEDKSALLNPSLFVTDDAKALRDCPVVIVAVPTPVDAFNKPDLTPLLKASRTVGENLMAGAVVVFESTVYPGVTEDICGPELANWSGLEAGKGFFLGYSPERVNPGDREHTIDKIVKIVSGSTPEVADLLQAVYGSVITAGIHKAPSIKTAEAAKVIENTQRDINIALVNELSQIFERINVDTLDVLAASATKWNFLHFRPGLVGGHCIGVDPYYLTHLAEGLGINPQVILAGRRINDQMSRFVAQKAVKMVMTSPIYDKGRIKVGVVGVTFKENVPDLRNTKVVDLIAELESFGCEVIVADPVADPEEYKHEYGRNLSPMEAVKDVHALIVAVAHEEVRRTMPVSGLVERIGPTKVLIDVKGIYDRQVAQAAGLSVWRP